MTRKQEIENAATAYVEKWYKEHDMHVEDFPTDVNISKRDFKAGAEWADKAMIEKGYEWLKKNVWNYMYELVDGTSIIDEDKLACDFVSAMEE